MKYIRQFGIILLITLLGEILKLLIPLAIPAGIYGLLLLLFALISGVVKLEHVKDAGLFLVEIMPILFIPAAVGIMASWSAFQDILLAVLLALTAVTILTMAVTGHVTQLMIRRREQREKEACDE
jgi:holin-like protein